MKMWSLATRNTKELLRDPLNLAFGLGFPLVLLLLLSAIQANIPVELFQIQRLSPGMAVFGLCFMTLFSATILAKDRSSALLQRLYTTPLTPQDFILSYTLPLIPLSVAQSGICYLAAVCLGLPLGIHILTAMLFVIPVCLLFVGMGLLFGSILNEKQVGGVCGALLTNLAAWLSGIWFDLELVGGTFRKIAHFLPFVHAVELERAALAGDMAGLLPHLWWVLGYDAVILAGAILLFLRQMRKGGA